MPARTAGRFFMWEEREDQRSQRRHLSHGVNVVCDVAWFWPASWIPLSGKISLILSSGEVRRNRIRKTGLESDPMPINGRMPSLHPPLKLLSL